MQIPENSKPVLSLIQLPSGQLAVMGPIDDIVRVYGLIEVMRDLVRAHHVAKQEGRGSVLPAASSDLHSLDEIRRRSAANGGPHP